MADKKPVLEVRNLSVALPTGADRVHAVEKVSFTVNPGEIVCLVGESGSGKSVIAFTVMGLLAKALKPTSGEILLEGENVLAAGETRLRELRCTRMSMIFQEPMTALNPVMTCGLQIDEVLETHTKLDAAERKAKIIAILTRVKLPEPERVYASYPHQLSGGHPQLITIAIPLVLDAFLPKARVVKAALAVDLGIRRGETLGIGGESGSGKSTVARCIARLIDPTLCFDDPAATEIATMTAGKLRPHRRRVQIVFQDPYRSMNPRITVGNSIIEGPMNFGLKRDEALVRARKLMETVRLDPNSLDRYPHQFSGVQRQRICIARALAMEPELLIADDAVSSLDVSVQKQVLELLDEILHRLNLSLLFIAPPLRLAAQFYDYVVVMSNGRGVEYDFAAQ